MFTKFEKLRAIIRNLGVDIAAQTQIRLAELWKGEIIRDNEGVIATSQGLFYILPDGTVIRVIVHVPQYSSGGMYLRDNPDSSHNWHKFHIFACQTVGQFRSLRKTTRNDGKFTYPIYNKNGEEYKPELRDGGRKLLLCQNCAAMLPPGMNADRANFDIQNFLSQQTIGGNFLGMNFVSDYDLIPNVYSKDWSKISRKLREMRNWTCEKCEKNLSAHGQRKFLHTHHRDAHAGHNSTFNLQALCIACHAREHPQNTFLHKSADLADYRRIFSV